MRECVNYNKLLVSLKERIEIKNQDGLDIIYKLIPDSNERGILDPRVEEILRKQPKFEEKEPREFSIEDLRKSMGFPNIDVTGGNVRTIHKTITGRNGDIPIRIYFPQDVDNSPAIIYFHGGGFIGGTLDTVENPCKFMAQQGNMVVVSVDYRLAPENKYPDGFNDCFDAVTWVYKNSILLNVDKDKIGVSGDSAGGNLAAVCSLLDRDMGTNIIKYQALIYPVVNLPNMSTNEYHWDINKYEVKNNNSLVLGAINALAGSGDLLNNMYLRDLNLQTNKYVSPYFEKDCTNLPKTLIVTAEYDFLRLQCEAYGRKLKEAGVQVDMICYRGMDHAFIDKIGVYPQADDCMNEIATRFLETF